MNNAKEIATHAALAAIHDDLAFRRNKLEQLARCCNDAAAAVMFGTEPNRKRARDLLESAAQIEQWLTGANVRVDALAKALDL